LAIACRQRARATAGDVASGLVGPFLPAGLPRFKPGVLAGAEAVFANGAKAAEADAQAVQAQLYEQIGRLKMELEWVNKKVAVLG
jgi:hypothetical protein